MLLQLVALANTQLADNSELPPIPSRSSVANLDLSKFGANDEQKLFRYLLRDYDKAVRPVFNASKIVKVYIGLTLTHIFNIDERNQVLALNVWVEQWWHDERVRWKPEEYGNISKFTLATRHVWTPDIVLYNNARDFSRGFVDTNLHANYNGELQWAPPQKIYSRCHMDVAKFPFDHQFCSLIFRSWIYDTSQLDLLILERNDGKSPFTRDSFTENGEWEIVDNRTFRYQQHSGNTQYATIVFELHLRRRTLFFMYNIVAPCVMLSILTIMQFLLPCESGEKVTLGLTVLLAYSVFSFNIAESMPETSEVIPLIAIYLMAIMGISALSVSFSVFVLNLRHGADYSDRIPRWLEIVGFSILAPVFGGMSPSKRKSKSKGVLNNGSLRLDNANCGDLVSKDLIDRVGAEQEFERLIARWSHLANIFDRLFFTVVLALNGGSTIFLLIVAPNMAVPSLQDRVWEL
ncbi:Nicotinic acetylcholine receptor subunit type G [Trichostrongylus colubriformis]|uniref:Nicotinic acetylcholine receptor subunit type G n=1 Tax=Trichostrongylus colubriformis TaxID=6319 RepID=A0AAN8I9X9_TRICO